MGFIDWISEPNAERRGQYLDATYPTGVVEPPTYPCPYCDSILDTKEALLRHTRTDHPLELPRLLLNGRPANSEEILRSSLDKNAIDLDNCTQIEVETGVGTYETFSEEGLCNYLAEQSDKLVRVRITNERSIDQFQATKNYSLSFKIAPHKELRDIENTFISMMETLPISISAANEFWKESRNYWNHSASGEYANALANYLIGLAIKEGEVGAEHLDFDTFKSKLSDSVAVLQQLNLPLARGLSGVIRLNLNHFGDWRNEAPAFPGLRATGTFFHDPSTAFTGERRKPRNAIEIMSKCPVDDLTERIIHATLMILEGRSSSQALESLLPPLLAWTPLAEYDRQKLHVLMATMHLQNGAHNYANPHLRALRADINFGAWALGCLER